MQTLGNPIVNLHGVVVFSTSCLMLMLISLCPSDVCAGLLHLEVQSLLPFPDTVNTSGFCPWNNGCVILMLRETDYVIIPGVLLLTHNTHLSPSPA